MLRHWYTFRYLYLKI